MASGPGGHASAGQATSLAASSLAFSNPSAAKIDQQRKILEELERQRKQLSRTQASSPGAACAPFSVGTSVTSSTSLDLSGQMTVNLPSVQRTALETASKMSAGFFIPQDSSFGNLILPVIPRLPGQNNP